MIFISDINENKRIFEDRFREESIRLNLFWLRIMKEHSFFLRLGLPCERRDLIERARSFEMAFERLLERFQGAVNASPQTIRALNTESIRLTQQLIEYKTMLILMMLQCQLGGFNYPLLIDHIRREAIRFVNKLQMLQSGESLDPVTDLIAEEVFWTRIMADHSKFINQLLDPSERQFIEMSEEFSCGFDKLRFQAEDFESFLSINPIFVPSLIRFNNDVITAISNIRDFKAEARNLISRCELVSLIPELLADHVLREAEHALQILRR